MPRSTNNPATRRRKNRLFKKAKGFVGGRRRLLRTAKETVQKGMVYATRDRRQRKREFRRLWNTRINAACRESGMSYSRLINALKKSKVTLNRKSLAEIAVRDAAAFKRIVEVVAPALKTA